MENLKSGRATAQENTNICNHESEYKYFIEYHLLSLIGIPFNNNLVNIFENDLVLSDRQYICQKDDQIYFSNDKKTVFSMKWQHQLSEDSIRLAENILRAFFQVSKYKASGRINLRYTTDTIRNENYKMAVQKGVCDWCAGTKNDTLYRLLQLLEEWSAQTYEGKKVTFGFIYDPMAKGAFSEDEYGTWLEFLKDDYAATLTDCIHSVIRLDKNCNFAGYISLTENNRIAACDLSSMLPYRFAQIIQTHVYGSRVGMFLLNNGDIIISKNRAIRLIKRNFKWLNLSYDMFSNMLLSKLDQSIKSLINNDFLKQIYASSLDVSLSHTGGIIAVVSNDSNLKTTLNVCDDLLCQEDLSAINIKMIEKARGQKTKELSNEKIKEIKKRILKRKAVVSLLEGKAFHEVDRKLRAELISMDGACILMPDGGIRAVGAIIQNDSGSAGGGRSSAAKKLSRHGMAVKISTDGYIELFVNEDLVYTIR